jgi:outer membrane protein OmpA-like peptidoglycan-associated protein
VVLGRQRAGMVFDYLYHHGISGDSMVRNSFAESDPVARGWDAGSMAKNRRVEIFVSRAFAGAAGFDAATPVASLKIGQRLVIQDLNFVNNEPVLLPESVPVIKMLLKYMEDNPGLEIKLSGHVCCTDDMLLSVERAKFVYDYLERNGIDADRMSYAGFSNHMPLAPNDMTDPEAAKVNRRVEIVIVKK